MKIRKKAAVLLVSVMMLQLPLCLNAQAKSKYDLQRQQYNSQARAANYSGKKFIEYEDKKISVSDGINKEGKTILTFQNEGGPSLMVKGSYLFYTDPDEHAIKKCKLDGSVQKTLVSYSADDYVNFIISGSNIIYSNKGLYTVTTKGKDQKKISGDVRGKFFTNGDDLFFASKSKLYKYNLKTGKKNTVKTNLKIKSFDIIGMEGSNLYLSNHEYVDFWEKSEKTSIYKFDTASGKKKAVRIAYVLIDEPVHSMGVAGGEIYLTTGTGAGNGFAKVKDSKADYESYYKKYDVGTVVTFYKDSIIMESYSFTESAPVFTWVKMETLKS